MCASKKGSDQMISILYKLVINPSLHNQLFRTLFEAIIVHLIIVYQWSLEGYQLVALILGI